MIVTAVDQRSVQYEKVTDHDAVVPVTIDIPALFENIMRVLPDTKTIAWRFSDRTGLDRGNAPRTRATLGSSRAEMVQ
jgi:hypothetical protein